MPDGVEAVKRAVLEDTQVGRAATVEGCLMATAFAKAADATNALWAASLRRAGQSHGVVD
jgi:hypothetical protein